MKLKLTRAVVWAAGIEDRPAGLAEKLAALSHAGANFEFILARRAPEQPGRGVVFLAPIKGKAQEKAAEKAGFMPARSLHSVRVEGADKPGITTKMTEAMAVNGVNLRGFSASVSNGKFIAYLAFDDVDEVKAATKALKTLS